MFEHAKPKLSTCRQWLEVDLCTPHSTLGWTLIGGGRSQARCVFWHHVSGAELALGADARRFFEDRRKERTGNTQGVGFLTGCTLAEFVESWTHYGELSARCIATVGLANALRVGDSPGTSGMLPGTINILLQTSCPLSECASLETLSLVGEARTLAVLDGNVTSNVSHGMATGTGTDCIVVASPVRLRDASERIYAGKHTDVGYVVGSCVHDAVRWGIRQAKLHEAVRL